MEKIVYLKYNYISDFQPVLFRELKLFLYRVYIETDRVRTDYNKKRNYNIGRLRPRIIFYNKYNSNEKAIGTIIGVDFKFRSNIIIIVSINIKIPDVRRIIKEIYRMVKRQRDKFTV